MSTAGMSRSNDKEPRRTCYTRVGPTHFGKQAELLCVREAELFYNRKEELLFIRKVKFKSYSSFYDRPSYQRFWHWGKKLTSHSRSTEFESIFRPPTQTEVFRHFSVPPDNAGIAT